MNAWPWGIDRRNRPRNDHLLNDIGIDRSEIRAVVDGMLSRPPARIHAPALHVVVADRARPAANDYADAA